MKTAAFVISLERCADRRRQVERIIAACPWPCEPTPAVDGSELSTDEIAKVYQRFLHRPRYPYALRPGEIGCFLSHRRIWQRIVDERIDAALILEDDIELQAAFGAVLDFAFRHMQSGDYIEFQVCDIGLWHPTVAQDGEFTLVRPVVTPRRTAAQLVTQAAARRLLEVTCPFDRPIDSFLAMAWLTGVPIKVAIPQCLIETSKELGGSTIGARKPLMDRMRRMVLRPLYRAKIALLSRWRSQPPTLLRDEPKDRLA